MTNDERHERDLLLVLRGTTGKLAAPTNRSTPLVQDQPKEGA